MTDSDSPFHRFSAKYWECRVDCIIMILGWRNDNEVIVIHVTSDGRTSQNVFSMFMGEAVVLKFLMMYVFIYLQILNNIYFGQLPVLLNFN